MIEVSTNPVATPRRSFRRAAMITAALASSFGILQLAPSPPRTNPPVIRGQTLEATLPPPAEVAGLLQAACANCHSNQTRWPWYSGIAPFSWLTGTHVNEGRRALNFSEWPAGEGARGAAIGKLASICAAVESGIMPPRSYLLMHPEARLPAAGKKAVCDWAHAQMAALVSGPAVHRGESGSKISH